MSKEKRLENLKPVRTREEAIVRGRKGGIATGKKLSLQKAVRETFKESMFGTFDDLKKKLEDEKLPMLSKTILTLIELSQNAKNENVKRMSLGDLLRCAGLEPEQVIRQEQSGTQTIYVTKKNEKETQDAISRCLARNNIINKKK